MRLSVILSVLIALVFVTRSEAAPQRDLGYEVAERSFQSSLTVDQRIAFQITLIAAGYLNGVPNENFNHRVYEAIERLQAENGMLVTGILDKPSAERLTSVALPMLNLWGFQTVSHPTRGIPLWVPLGLGLIATRNQFGLHYEDPQRRMALDFTTVPNVSIGANLVSLGNDIISKGGTIHYKVAKDGWFVISATAPDGVDYYFRYHQDGSNVTGFALSWNNANGNISGERVAILMSASLWSTMTGAIRLPALDSPKKSPPDQSSQVAAVQPPTPPPAKPSEPQITTGTAFFVSQDGALVTNAHVVAGCSEIRVKGNDGVISDGRVIARDVTNDLAILKVDKTSSKIAALRTGVRLGEGVETFGYPHADILSSSGNFTLGNITALSGIGDDSRFLQMSAPVQAGNSGGPLLDQSGNLVGVVAAKLNALKVAVTDGDLPQNVNFAIKASILATFLDSNRIIYQQGADTKPLDPADIADRARAISAFVMCR